MRTGVKTFFLTKKNALIEYLMFYSEKDRETFPVQPINLLRVKFRLYKIKSSLRKHDMSHNFGALYTLPHPIATKPYKYLIDYNPGNLGNWSSKTSSPDSTAQIEHEVIHKMINLYGGNKHQLKGYITSGGTEGNFFSIWLGKTYLQQKNKKDKICLLASSLTHYSIEKASRLCDIDFYLLPLNTNDWNIDLIGLEQIITKLYRKGYRGFSISATLGYALTGTCDDVERLVQITSKLKKTLENSQFFIFVDAAFNGFIEPFLNTNFKIFNSGKVQSFAVDLHKFGLTPYSAGIVIYNKSLAKLIERPVSFLYEADATLLGSRSGIPAVSAWAIINSFGQEKYKHMAEVQMTHKVLFVQKLKAISSQIEIIDYQFGLTCGVIFHNLRYGKLPEWIENKYELHPSKMELLFYPNRKKKVLVYKFFFLPHMTKKIVLEFIYDFTNTL
jgi:glutamate/tyrosine decarboxylase-like PLP-dependent enzyme